ncbi:hypothetical protein QC762_0063170 [Podospora pseudocomata]|uniref:Heterokaryon incompatibility domain-containing protein n=1 Tax=Podospora pseudocomata TaxID=2093779 RepID=A0ABR0GF12_9PEZI|nr:hypothetical protein QC762_0063170 [Podospora pseudocomata]
MDWDHFFLLTHNLHINRRVQLSLSLFLTAYLWFLPVLATVKPPLYALSILVVAYGHAYWRYGINPFAQIDSAVSLAGRISRVAFVTIGHCWSDSLVGRLWLVRFPVIFFYDLEIKAYWTFILVPLAYKLRLQRVFQWFQVERRAHAYRPSQPKLPLYTYTPLSPEKTTIPLLLVHLGHRHKAMSCNLFEVEFKSAPPFAAISYRWAQAERDDGEHIIVSDCTLGVASNVFELLGDLRSTLLPRLIWIDSICIDQLSENEKSYQVYLMGDIDSSASLVTIWLGSPSREMSWTTLNRVIRWLPKRITEVDYFDRILKSIFATLAFRLIDQLRINTSFTRDNLKAYREVGKYRFTAWWIPLMHLLEHE